MKEKITANQFFLLFFLCSVYFLSTISSEALGDNFTDSIFSAGISTLANFVLSLPLLLLHDQRGSGDSIVCLRECFGKGTKTILLLYVLYFLAADITILTLMQNLLVSTIFPTVVPVFIGLMAVFVAVYGALKRIEAVARTALFVFVVFIVGCVAIFAGALELFRFENRQVPLYNGPKEMWQNSLVLFARSTFIPQMFFLLSFVKGKVLKKSIFWNAGVGVVLALVFIFIIHALGQFVSTQLFPVYTLSSISKIEPLQRLDIVFTAMWIMLLTIRLSCDFICIKSCLRGAVAERHSVLLLVGMGFLVLVAAFFLTDQKAIQLLLQAVVPIAVAAGLLGSIVPLILLLKRRKHQHPTGEHLI